MMNFVTKKIAIIHAYRNASEYNSIMKSKNEKEKEVENENKIEEEEEELNEKEKEITNENENEEEELNDDDDDQINSEIKSMSLKNKDLVNNERGSNDLHNEYLTADDKNKIDIINERYNSFSKTFLYKFKTFNPLSMLVKLTEFIDDHKDVIKDSYNLASDIKYCIQNKGKSTKRCERFEYNGFRKILLQQVRIYATNKFPSILNLVGYSTKNKRQFLYVEYKGNGTLENVIKSNIKMNKTQQLIIAYGIACGLKSLHANRIIHRNLNLSSISLDLNYYPYISDFYYAAQIDSKLPYLVTETNIEFMAPEFIKDYKSNQYSFMLDVYAYGVILFMIISNKNPFDDRSYDAIRDDTESGKRPEFNVDVDGNWKKLITKCWNQDPNQRPNFIEICDTIENDLINDSIDLIAFNNYKKMLNRNHK